MRTVGWFVIFGGLLVVAGACAKGETDPDGGESFKLNGGDETGDGEESDPETCTESQFECADGDCIAKMYACDTIEQCSDGSDEYPANTDCPSSSCTATQWACNDGSCIASSTYVCDGYADCADMSDEGVAMCGTTCTAGQWTCTNGECIPAEYFCDAISDCTDGSDESAC